MQYSLYSYMMHGNGVWLAQLLLFSIHLVSRIVYDWVAVMCHIICLSANTTMNNIISVADDDAQSAPFNQTTLEHNASDPEAIKHTTFNEFVSQHIYRFPANTIGHLLLAVYIMMTNVLLLNLLIAMFRYKSTICSTQIDKFNKRAADIFSI